LNQNFDLEVQNYLSHYYLILCINYKNTHELFDKNLINLLIIIANTILINLGKDNKQEGKKGCFKKILPISILLIYKNYF